MAYHIVNFNSEGEPEFWNNISKDTLLTFDYIYPHSIIYDLNTHKPPYLAKDNKDFEIYTNINLKLGSQAEKLFKKQATFNNFMIEKIDQSIEAMEDRKKILGPHIKRADYSIRNLRAEVEVKCLSCYPSSAPIEERYFYFNYYQLQCHIRDSNHTGDRCYIALYLKENNKIIEDSLRMICLQDIDSNKNKYQYDEDKKAYKIYLSNMNIGFDILHTLSACQ